MHRTAQERFDEKWNLDVATGCHLWTAHVTKDGYGSFSYQGRKHRVALILDGRDPGNLLALHSCDTPLCVNPEHLRPGTHTDNARERSLRGRSAGQKVTHCPAKHEYTPENTNVWRGKRKCLKCGAARARERRARDAEVAA